MIERNQPCPCGSGKKYKKCCGAGAGAANATAGATQRAAAPQGGAGAPGGALSGSPPPQTSSDREKPFLITTGRGLHSERTETERKKHLRKRIQSPDMRGTLVYNSGAFFKPPNP
jgi:hypothetical protein